MSIIFGNKQQVQSLYKVVAGYEALDPTVKNPKCGLHDFNFVDWDKN